MPSTSSRRVPPWAVVALVVAVLVVWALARTGSGSVGDPPAALPSATATAGATATGPAGPTPSDRRTPDSGLATVAESALPPEAATTLALIRAGGPFPHEEDGGRFGNRERILPQRASGYYREYTVETPGEGDRGPRRLVAGAGGDLYWTSDHYASFRQVQEGR